MRSGAHRPAPTSPPESRDSAWLAVAVVAAVAMLTAGVMVVINTAPSGEELPRMTAGEMSFANPHGWDIASGDAGQPEDAHECWPTS